MGRKSKLKLVVNNPVLSSDPTPERVLRSGGHFEEGKDGRGAKILTFKDYPLAVAHRTGKITTRQLEAGERYHQYWYSAGLAGSVPTMVPTMPQYVIDGEAFWRPLTTEQYNFRLMVRAAWGKVPWAAMRVIEAGVCWGKWETPWDSPGVQRGLNKLADHWNIAA